MSLSIDPRDLAAGMPRYGGLLFDEKRMTLTLSREACDCTCADCEARVEAAEATSPAYTEPLPGCEGTPRDPVYGYGYMRNRHLGVYLRDGTFVSQHEDMGSALAAMVRVNDAAGWKFPDLPAHDITVPAVFSVCPLCGGKGSHVNPSIDAGGITSDDEFWGDDEDPMTGESCYMRGDYDVECYECHGKRVVPVPDERARAKNPNVKIVEDHLAESAMDRRNDALEAAYETRMGC